MLLVGLPKVAAGVGIAAGGLLAVALFDIVTVKLRIRPPEPRPARRDTLDAFDLMRARRSCRSFQNGRLNHVDREAVLASVQRHVAADTLGPAPIRLEYVHARVTVWPTVNATEFLVALAPLPYDRRSVIDVGRVLQKVVLDATSRGLGTCWIGPGADHDSLKAHLGGRFDEERDQIICTCAIGYPSVFIPLFVRIFNRMFRQRAPLSELFFADPDLTVPLDVRAAPCARFGRTFEACQWAPSSYNGQTTRAVVRTAHGEVAGVEFHAAIASRYYAPVALGIWCANWEIGCEALGIDGRFEACPPPAEAPVPPRHDVTWRPCAEH
ncbi:MAG: nitroreductase [Myxococcota bacterium]